MTIKRGLGNWRKKRKNLTEKLNKKKKNNKNLKSFY